MRNDQSLWRDATHYRDARARLLEGVSLHRQALRARCPLARCRLSALRVLQRQLAALRQARTRLGAHASDHKWDVTVKRKVEYPVTGA